MTEAENVAPVTMTAYIAEFGVDMDGQRMDPEWLWSSVKSWMMHGGYVTAMFGREPVGKCENIARSNRGVLATVSALDLETSRRICAGVYKGLGAGISGAVVKKDPIAPHGLICGGTVVSVTLLDEPITYTESITNSEEQ